MFILELNYDARLRGGRAYLSLISECMSLTRVVKDYFCDIYDTVMTRACTAVWRNGNQTLWTIATNTHFPVVSDLSKMYDKKYLLNILLAPIIL